ncbi:MAG: FxLYD domain-containing protein [Bacteriovoracia bacterium]
MKKSILFGFAAVFFCLETFATEKIFPVLELTSSTWTHESDSEFAIVVGQVKNISKNKYDYVEAVANFSDAKGNLIATHSSLIQYNPILSDQVSPFKIMVPWNPAFKTLNIEFQQTMRGKLEHRTKKK